MGAPYALSSDLVSAWPAKSLEVAQYIDGDVPLLAMPQNTQTGVTYSLVAADVTKLVTVNNGGAVAVTLPLEASVPWATSTQLRLLNLGAGTVTVAGAAGVTINGTPLTLAQFKGAILTKTGTDTWVFLPFSGGSAAAVISSTTGSPTITTDGTATIYTFTGDGTLVVGTPGVVRVLGHGGGGGAGGAPASGGGGGAGAALDIATIYLGALTHVVKIGAGGSGCTYGGEDATAGGLSALNNVGFAGGGRGTRSNTNGGAGGSGGGAGGGNGGSPQAGGATTCQGFAGGASVSNAGGGGGAGAVGVAGTTGVGGAGGAGLASDIVVALTNVTRGGGGGGTSTALGAGGSGGGGAAVAGGVGNAGQINTGSGGGGTGGGGAGTGGAGGSGVVIVKVG